MILKKIKQLENEKIKLLLSLKKREIKNSEYIDKKFKNVIIPFNVRKIGNYAFCESGIKNLKLSSKVNHIGISSFAYNNIVKLNIPDTVTYIGPGAFSNNKIKKLKLSNNLKIISARTFQNNGLEEIEIPINVQSIESDAFGGNNIKYLDLSNNKNLKIIGSYSFELNKLTNLILPNNLEIISNYAFYNNKLTSVDIPDSVVNLGKRAFCYNRLKEVKLSNNLTKISPEAFKKNELASIYIPDKVEVIGHSSFSNNALKKVRLSNNSKEIESEAFNYNLLSNLNIPNSVVSIGNSAFSNNRLKDINLSNNINYIGESAFSNNNITSITIPDSIIEIKKNTFKFNDLKTVNLTSNLKIIQAGAFSNNKISILRIPDTVEEIGEEAFEKNNIQLLSLPSNLKVLKPSAFANNKLLCVIIPGSLKCIPHSAFKFNRLKEVIISEGVETIQNHAFEFNNLEEVTIPNSVKKIAPNAFSANVILKNDSVLNDIITIINDINRIKVEDIELFYKNNLKIKQLCSDLLKCKLNNQSTYYQMILTKIRKIYYKTRLEYLPSLKFIECIDEDLINNFDFNIWKYFENNNIFDDSAEMNEALLDILDIFGLFEKDKNKYNRLEKFKEIFKLDFSILTNSQYDLLDAINKKYYKKSTRKELVLKDNVLVPDYALFYLTNTISDARYKYIKNLKGTEGARINKLLKELYEYKEVDYYNLDKKYYNDPTFYDYILDDDIPGKVTRRSIHRIFSGNDFLFDEERYNFLVKYFDIILESEELQSLTPTIIEKYYEIKKEYNISDNELPTLKQCYSYCLENEFEYEFGNKELAEMASTAGVSSEEAYKYYEELNELVKQRKNSVLIRSNDIYTYNGITLRGRILKTNDSFAMFVGEVNYSNCCQSYRGMGEECLKHASTSLDGGIFEVSYLKDGEWILLSQSWDWQNENIYCHDNIEGTSELKGNSKLKDAIIYVYKEHATKIIEESSKYIDNYINNYLNKLERSNSTNEEKNKIIDSLEELRLRQKIKVVTIGNDYSDINLSNYFKNTIRDIRQPKNYNDYSDSRKTQYIVEGKHKELIPESISYKQIPIYRDERLIAKENGQNIKQSTLKLIHDIEKKTYPKEMIKYSNDNESLIKQPYLLADIENEYVDDLDVIYGEDWYFIYGNDYDNITLYDLAKDTARFDDEQTIQMQEISNALKEVLNTSIKENKTLTASLREDTSYLIYLMYLKEGLIEQIGSDLEYKYMDYYNKKRLTEEEQLLKLKDIKRIRRNEESKTTIHKVTFKPTKKYIDKYYNVKKKVLTK